MPYSALILESPTLTVINLVAALITIVASAVIIFIFFRQRQFSRPGLELIVGWGAPPKEVPRKFRRTPVTLLVIAPKKEFKGRLVAYMIYGLKNSGRETVRNVRISIEYPKKYLINNARFASLAEFKPVVVHELSNTEKAAVVSPAVTGDEMKKTLEDREVNVFEGRAQVSVELPLLRPGEVFVLYDVLQLAGSGPEGIEKLGFGDTGFGHVVDLLRQIPSLLDYFVVHMTVYAENLDRLDRKVSFLRFSSEAAQEKDLLEFRKALWFGRLPQSGFYFTNPFYRWLARKMNWIGRSSKSMSRMEAGLMRYSIITEMETQTGEKFMVELPTQSLEEYFLLNVPNCDYLDLPPQVSDFESLMKWLGISSKPTLPLPGTKQV